MRSPTPNDHASQSIFWLIKCRKRQSAPIYIGNMCPLSCMGVSSWVVLFILGSSVADTMTRWPYALAEGVTQVYIGLSMPGGGSAVAMLA